MTQQAVSTRVELPSGGWWELKPILARRTLKAFMESPPERDMADFLIEQTVAWSFPEPPSVTAANEKDWRDFKAALDGFFALYGLRSPAQVEELKKD